MFIISLLSLSESRKFLQIRRQRFHLAGLTYQTFSREAAQCGRYKMGLNNDTRGWIMTSVSGIGDSLFLLLPLGLYLTNILYSLCGGLKYHLYRLICPKNPWKTQLSNPRQQWVLILVIKPQFWGHGKSDCPAHGNFNCIF